MTKIKREKPCKRKKCPYYDMYFKRCESCEWNPESTWGVKKGKLNNESRSYRNLYMCRP